MVKLTPVPEFDFANAKRPRASYPSEVTTVENSFLEQVFRKNTFTENGAVSHSTTGSNLLDQFAVCGSSRNRDLDAVFLDCRAVSVEQGFRLALYIRAVSRQTKVEGEDPTKTLGQGNRDESLKRLLYYAYFEPEVFDRNAWIIPVVGRFKDLVDLYVLDTTHGSNSVNVKVLIREFLRGLNTDSQRDLALKYLPQIKALPKCKTQKALLRNQFAKLVRDALSLSDKEYRRLKTSGTAHEWQQAISRSEYDSINWDRVSGIALSKLATGKFLENHNLEDSFEAWLDSKDVVNYNGYPYQLASLPRYNRVQRKTVNKQFDNLIELGKKGGAIRGNVWCAVDTSGSMMNLVGRNSNVTALDVCTSISVYFATLNQGPFHKNVIMFDSQSRVLQLNGGFCDMMEQLPLNAMGSTNFSSVIAEICRIRNQNPSIPLEDYPQTLLVVSDMQFNPVATDSYWGGPTTNHEAALKQMRKYFPDDFVDNFKFVWWNVIDRFSKEEQDFPSTLDDGGTYLFSGFDGAVISFLLGGTFDDSKAMPSMQEILDNALYQPIFEHLEFSP